MLYKLRNAMMKSLSRNVHNFNRFRPCHRLVRFKSTHHSQVMDELFERALDNAKSFDEQYNYQHSPQTVPHCVRTLVTPIRPFPNASTGHLKPVPVHIPRPPYAWRGRVPPAPHHVVIQDEAGIKALRKSARLARDVLDISMNSAKAGMTANDIDDIVHDAIVAAGAYPSPLNYAGFPKSVCSSVNEVICHGIPDDRELKDGDVASFDVSCFLEGYHGDNCGTVLIGDEGGKREKFDNDSQELLFITGRRLIRAAKEALDTAIETCQPGSCLTEVGNAIHAVTDAYGYASVEKYRGHGIGRDFHCPPFVKHYRNNDAFILEEGMVFTIEPMITEGRSDCAEWQSDGWTVVTRDGGRAAQFEHMVAITDTGAEVLTLPSRA
jgi:methionyl aminopeptidase